MSGRSEIYGYFCLFLRVDGIVYQYSYILMRLPTAQDIVITLLVHFCVTDLDLYEMRMYRIYIRLLNDSIFMSIRDCLFKVMYNHKLLRINTIIVYGVYILFNQ